MSPLATKFKRWSERIAELEGALAGLQALPPVEDEPKPLGMNGAWGKNGFEAVSNDGNFTVHIGGRVQLDAVALGSSDLVLGGVGTDDAVDFRRARLRVDGTMYKTMSWAAEFDFVNGQDYDPTNPATPINAFRRGRWPRDCTDGFVVGLQRSAIREQCPRW